MPYRKEHSVLATEGERYLLKWKQPALNWLIPRSLYEDVGPFCDEGIAYDTVYSHWMRLKNHPVICLTPSHVQNIGFLGAYATDDTTTCRDFMGEGTGDARLVRLGRAAHFTLKRLPGVLRHVLDDAATLIAPIRWGTEFVHEGRARNGESVAVYSFDDAERLGWDRSTAARRVDDMRKTGAANLPVLRTNRQGAPVWVEVPWRFSPNLREMTSLSLPRQAPGPETLFRELIGQLIPLHDRDIAHNKIRRDNIYVGEDDGKITLAWLGTEPSPGTDFLIQDTARTRAMLSGALNRWALESTREEYAARYLESLAPEVMQGLPATPASDVFSAAAVTALGMLPAIQTLGQMTEIHRRWAQGIFSELDPITDTGIRSIMKQCLESDPLRRPENARRVAELLDR
jgi:hypothetical protein